MVLKDAHLQSHLVSPLNVGGDRVIKWDILENLDCLAFDFPPFAELGGFALFWLFALGLSSTRFAHTLTSMLDREIPFLTNLLFDLLFAAKLRLLHGHVFTIQSTSA